MNLLQSCTQCELYHDCSILQKSRDLHLGWRGDGGTDTKLYGGTLPDCTAATILKMAAKNLVESRSFLIMWTKPPRVLLTHIQNNFASSLQAPKKRGTKYVSLDHFRIEPKLKEVKWVGPGGSPVPNQSLKYVASAPNSPPFSKNYFNIIFVRYSM